MTPSLTFQCLVTEADHRPTPINAVVGEGEVRSPVYVHFEALVVHHGPCPLNSKLVHCEVWVAQFYAGFAHNWGYSSTVYSIVLASFALVEDPRPLDVPEGAVGRGVRHHRGHRQRQR